MTIVPHEADHGLLPRGTAPPLRPPPATYQELTADLAGVPDSLCDSPRWLLWRYEWRQDPGNPGKWTKVPIHHETGARADGTPTETGLTLYGALDAAERLRARGAAVSGVGLALGDGLTGVDLDGCRDPGTGALAPWALAVVDALDSFTELSPSGTGIHTICAGRLPPGRRRTGPIEMYDRGRFFTVTGRHLDGTPETVEERTEQLAAWHAETFPATPPPPAAARPVPTLSLDDAEVARRARESKDGARFDRLMAGDTSDYATPGNGGESEADLALCNLLRFWTGGDRAQVERIWGASGLGRRDKWHRDDYRARTLDRAMPGDVWTPPAPATNGRYRAPAATEPDPSTDEGAAEDEGPGGPDGFPLTDAGNAQRLLAAYGARLRYCALWGTWLVYDGRRWAEDPGDCRIGGLAHKMVRRLFHTAADLGKQGDKKGAKRLFNHALSSESAGSRAALVKLARMLPGVLVTPDELDADPWVLNCQNGTVDLRTGALRRHDPADLMTKIAPVTYDPAAACPTWERFVSEVTAAADGTPDPEMAEYVQRAIGHSLTGDQSEQAVYFPYGKGANGKSTLLNAVKDTLGEYAMQAGDDLLMEKRGSAHPTEVMDLYRRRLVVSTEVEDGRRLAEALVKKLSGGEPVRGRRMRENPWQFEPTHTVWVAANHKPEIRGTDHAIWRRIRLVPFDATFYDPGKAPPGQEQRIKDATLPDSLRRELPGILAWEVRGCLDWQTKGIAAPRRVQEATKTYRQEMDVAGDFLTECCLIGESYSVFSTPLYEAYTAWCGANRETPLKRRQLAERLRERGFTNKDSTAGRSRWFGLGLLKPESATDGAQRGPK